jgi:cell wall-associated NlpC family hydrolase
MTQAIKDQVRRAEQSPFLPVALLALGGYLTWFGVHYWRSDVKWPSDPIKNLLQGKPIPVANRSDKNIRDALGIAFSTGATGSTPTGGSGGSGPTGPLSGPNPAIAAAALKYQGAGYTFGGNASRVGDWDCSSFVSYVLGHDIGMSLPGGGRWGSPGYPPHAHGPVAASYKLFGNAINRQQLGAGDIVAWNTHVGIAIDGSRIISARTPSEGTGISTIDGTSNSIGETPAFRRVAAPVTGPVITV